MLKDKDMLILLKYAWLNLAINSIQGLLLYINTLFQVRMSGKKPPTEQDAELVIWKGEKFNYESIFWGKKGNKAEFLNFFCLFRLNQLKGSLTLFTFILL